MKLPQNILRRGRKLSVIVRDPKTDKRRFVSTGIDVDSPGAVAKAVEVRDKLNAKLAAGYELSEGTTVAKWAKTFFSRRSNWNKHDEQKQWERYIEPTFGKMRIEDVKPHHVHAWVRSLSATGRAPKTIRNIYGVAFTLFGAAKAEELIVATPFDRNYDGLPAIKKNKDGWRAKARFSLAEVEQLISDDRQPLRRRVANALLFLAGVRSGEFAALQWRCYNPGAEPLGRLDVSQSHNKLRKVLKGTKQDEPRSIPVHPVLAKLLAEWKLSYTLEYGHHPRDNDLIFPAGGGAKKGRGFWTQDCHYRNFQYWLAELDLPRRRLHDTRRTFVSLCKAAGVDKDVLRWFKDGRPAGGGDSIEDYHEPDWGDLCGELSKLKIVPHCNRPIAISRPKIAASGAKEPSVLQLQQDLAQKPSQIVPELVSASSQVPEITSGEVARPAGVEPAAYGFEAPISNSGALLPVGGESPYVYGATRTATPAEKAIGLDLQPEELAVLRSTDDEDRRA